VAATAAFAASRTRLSAELLLDVAGQLALEVDIVLQVGATDDALVELSARCSRQ
jgi:hypothetical protein